MELRTHMSEPLLMVRMTICVFIDGQDDNMRAFVFEDKENTTGITAVQLPIPSQSLQSHSQTTIIVFPVSDGKMRITWLVIFKAYQILARSVALIDEVALYLAACPDLVQQKK